jgi:O-antigen/teichoic acid export membrane protein
VIQTAFITIALAGGIFLLIAYPVIIFVLKLILPSISFEKAISILPFAIISLWVVVITSIFQSGIDGYQRIDVRSFVMIGSSFFHLILSFVLVPHYGLMGLAYARTIQTITVLIISWVIIKRFIPALPFFPYKWDLKVFREIIRYGVNFQAISILQMLCEPTTKALLARFGDLAMVGYYEMASRMLMQFRSLLVSANQVLVPVIAKFQEQNSENIFKIYKLNYRLIFYLSVPYYSMIIAGTPLISELWIGEYVSEFVLFSILFGISLLVNTLSVPAYFSYLGIGILKWNVLGHAITAFGNIILGFFVGYIFGGIGVVSAWVVSSIVGSLFIVVSYHFLRNIPLGHFFLSENKMVSFAGIVVISFSIFFVASGFNNPEKSLWFNSLFFLLSFILTFVPFWINSNRKLFANLVFKHLFLKNE